MNEVLDRWNQLPAEEAAQEILACCGSLAWARGLAARRPFPDEASLVAASDEIWGQLGAQDWMEAFSRHPRLGERKAPQLAPARSTAWSSQEQEKIAAAGDAVQAALLKANRKYERRFARVFIVCATGKSADEIVDILQRRLQNDDARELQVAAEEQRKITNTRLKKWLHE
jgi:2-oxo-4-hydroxy-4-carboxy-5-ureidoimidazoline decarboxylase